MFFLTIFLSFVFINLDNVKIGFFKYIFRKYAQNVTKLLLQYVKKQTFYAEKVKIPKKHQVNFQFRKSL